VVVSESPVEVQRDSVTDPRLDLPQGTLDLLILKALSLAPMHGRDSFPPSVSCST